MSTDFTEAHRRFHASMDIGYEQWHDGTPYDLDALDAMAPEAREAVTAMLIARPGRHWRDIEALARIGTAEAMAAIRADLESADENTRLFAARTLEQAGEPIDPSPQIVAALQQDDTFGGLTQALELAARFPSEAVLQALIEGARSAPDNRGVHFAALLYFIRGKADEEFDWSRRPFFLRFTPDDPPDRERAFAEMCAELGLEP